MSRDLPHTIRQNPLTDELKQRVAQELGQLAAARDLEISKFVGLAHITSAGGTLKPNVMQALAGMTKDAGQPEINVPTRSAARNLSGPVRYS